MEEIKVKALFELANLPIKNVHEIANEYWPKHFDYDEIRRGSPWWLVSTNWGLIKIGWRKRVISISWDDTPIKFIVTADDVTKNETLVHAYSYGKAVDYLTILAARLKLLIENGESNG